MGGRSKGAKTQVSAYLMSLHVGFCYSVDVLLEILVKEKSVWKGWSTSNETLTIDQKNLFGGEKKEGGLLGGVEIMHGRSSQVMREDLAGRLGRTSANTPGFRDILSMFFYGAPGYGFMWSMNYPYLHSIWAKVKRTETGWYASKSDIYTPGSTEPSQTLPVALAANTTSLGGEGPGIDLTLSTPGSVTVTAGEEAWAFTPYDGYGGFTNGWTYRCGLRNMTTAEVYTIWLGTWATKSEAESAMAGQIHVWDGLPAGDYRFFMYDAEVDDNRGTGSYTLTLGELLVDMNPAHIIRECFTNADWGMGLPGARIDDAAFTEAADILYDEGFGLSMVWSGQSSVETFVDEVLEHIDGVYGVDPSTGKIYIRLIRGGYDLGSLEELTEDDGKITQFNRKAVEETTNEIVVTWTNPDNEGEETVSVHDLANYAAQQTIISSSRNYYGIRSSSLAIRAALRELNKASQPLASFEMQVSRKAWNYKPGDVLKITSAEYGLNALPCRIVKTNYGKPGEMAIKLTLIEDVFEMPESSYVVSEPTLWEPVVPEIAAVSNALVITAPYFALARTLGDAAASGVTDTEAYSLILAQSSGLVELFTSSVNAAGNTSYASAGTIEPCGRGTLASGLAQEVTSTVSLSGYSGIDLASGIFLLIGTEVAIVESVSPLVVRRGMLDTVPKVWAVDTEVWAFDWNADLSDEVEHLVGATVNYRLAPDGQGGDPYIARSATLTKRAVRPYRPANVRINTQLWPEAITGEIDLDWSHRNRLLETSVPLKWDEASTTPEPGTTYNVKFYSDGFLVKSETLSGTASWLTYEEEISPGSGDPHEASVVLRMDMEGVTPVDEKGHTITVHGDAQIVTAPVGGGSALRLDGGGDYLTFAAASDLNFGSSDFTWRAWITRAAVTDGAYADAIWCSAAAPVGFAIGINPDGKIGLAIDSSGGGDWDIRKGVDPGDPRGTHVIPLNTRTHIQVCRSGNTFYGFVNGDIDQTFTSSAAISDAPSGYHLGHWHDGWTRYFNGYIDDLEITIGIARNTTNFIPPGSFATDTSSIGGNLRVTLEAVRDGHTSEQMFDCSFARVGYGLQYGNYYGGI